MADTVTTQVIENLPLQRRKTYQFTGVSDGTGEAAVAKIDISGLTGAPTAVKILKIEYSISYAMSIKIGFDHTTDDFVAVLSGQGCLDYTNRGGLKDPGSAGGTGDIIFTTVGAASTDTYTILLEIGW